APPSGKIETICPTTAPVASFTLMIGPGWPLAPFVPLTPGVPCLPAGPWTLQRTFFHPFGHFFFAALPWRRRISPVFLFTHAVSVFALAADAGTSTAPATTSTASSRPQLALLMDDPLRVFVWWDYAKDMSDGARAS